MHTHAVQRGGADLVQPASSVGAHCQVVRSGGRGGHWGRHNPAPWNTCFGGLADGAPSAATSAVHTELLLLLLLLLLLVVLMLLLPKDVVHTICVHAILHRLCVLSRQPGSCVHHVSLGAHSYHVASA